MIYYSWFGCSIDVGAAGRIDLVRGVTRDTEAQWQKKGYLGFGFGLAVRTGKPKAEAHSRKNEKNEKKGIFDFGIGRSEAVRIDLKEY